MDDDSSSDEDNDIFMSDIAAAGIQPKRSLLPSQSNKPPQALSRCFHQRCVLHVDVDCFYAQSAFIRNFPNTDLADEPPIAMRQVRMDGVTGC